MTLAGPLVKCQLSFAAKSGIPRDTTQVSFYFKPPGNEIPVDGGSGTVIIDALVGALDGFLNQVAAGATVTMGALLGPGVSRLPNHVNVQLYSVPVTQGLMGPPFSTRGLSLTGSPATNGEPAEVAACLTYHADLAGIPERGPNNTRPASNRRGRIYWGPLSVAHTVDPDTGRIFLSSAARDALVMAARDFLFQSADAAGWVWSVFSRALWQYFIVKGVFADDAFDTQRRRGEDPIQRVSLVFP